VKQKDIIMGLQVILNIYQVDADTSIDIPACNVALMNLGMGELYQEFSSDPSFNGPFSMDGDVLTVAGNWDCDFTGYGESTMIWGCFSEEDVKEFSRHIKSGKVVFHIDIEGNPHKWYVCTPNNVEETRPKF
jgi:hypothetical protein